MKDLIVTQNESYAIDSSPFPEKIRLKIEQEDDNRKSKIKAATDPNKPHYKKLNEMLIAEFHLEDEDPDNYRELPRLLANKVCKDADDLINCLSILQGSPLGLHVLPSVGKETLKDEKVRAAILQYVDLLQRELLGDENVDAVLYGIFESLTEDGRFKDDGFGDAKKAIDLVSKNCSPKIFHYLHEILKKTENLKPEVKCASCKHTFKMGEKKCPKCKTRPPHELCRCEPQLGKPGKYCPKCGKYVSTLESSARQNWLDSIKGGTTDLVGKFENFIKGEIVTIEQINELYGKILKGFKSSLDELTKNNIVSPLLYDKSYVRDIIERYSPEQNPVNVEASSWENFNNVRSEVLDNLITYYGNITKEIDKAYFSGGSNPISFAIKRNIVYFIVTHPESKLRLNTLKAFDEKGDLTIDIVKDFLRRKLNRQTMVAKWKSERDVKKEAVKIFIGLLTNGEYKNYHEDIILELSELVTESKNEIYLEDLELRKYVIEALVNHRELKLINFQALDEIDTGIEDNEKLHAHFYRYIQDKLVSDHVSNKFDLAHFLLKDKYILKHLLLHTAIKPEEKERVVDIFRILISSENLKALQVFYEIIQEIDIERAKENKKVITYIMDSIICSDLMFDYGKLSDIIRKAHPEKVNAIMRSVESFIDKRRKIDPKVIILLESIFTHPKLSDFDRDVCNLLVDRVYDRLKETDQNDKLNANIFQKMLNIKIVGKEVKEKIVSANIEIFLKKGDPAKEIIDFIKNNFIFDDNHH